jgi:hypothetical protein
VGKPGLTFIFFFFLPPIASLAGENSKVWNLRDISAFQLIVERPTEDAREVGITEEAVRNQIAALFKASLSRVPLDRKEGPSLYVRIVLYKRQKEDLYYGMISVNVDRAVMVLSPRENFPTFSQVWENTVVFSGRDPLPGTYRILADLINLLVEDFKKANP